MREILWAGRISRFTNPGCCEYFVMLRIVRDANQFTVERMSRDAMREEAWIAETDVENVTLAFGAYIIKHA